MFSGFKLFMEDYFAPRRIFVGINLITPVYNFVHLIHDSITLIIFFSTQQRNSPLDIKDVSSEEK